MVKHLLHSPLTLTTPPLTLTTPPLTLTTPPPTGKATSYVATSDIRLKRNITSSVYGLSSLMKLIPVEYYWTTDYVLKTNTTDSLQSGFLAQEVEAVVPELVKSAKDAEGMKALEYSRVSLVVVQAIKEQAEEIHLQGERLHVQEERVASLRQEYSKKTALLDSLTHAICQSHPMSTVCQRASR